MRLTVQGSTIRPTPAIAAHVRRRLAAALGRIRHRVAGVVVTLEDENGPSKGGVDKSCRLKVALAGMPGGPVIVEQRSDDLYAAIDAASRRAARAVRRSVSRQRTLRRAPAEKR
jgi:ribosomal subunit interface protein